MRRLGHLSDFHFGKPPSDDVASEDAVEKWLTHFADAGVDLLLVTGDLIEEPGDRTLLRRTKEMLDEAPFPWVVIPGNHDVPEPGTPGPFEELFGEYPRVERHGGIELVLIDSMQGLPPSERSPEEREEAEASNAFSCGKVGEAQLRAVEENLAAPPAYGRLLLVHHHLRKNAPTEQGREEDPTAPKGLMGPLVDAEELLDWASDQDVQLIFHGHKHNFWDPYEPRPGLIVLNSGSSTRGKSTRPRRARIVDVWPHAESITVHDLEFR